jgi:serine/threonine protein kinase
MKKLLIKNPEHRPSAEEVLNHEWFKTTNAGGFTAYIDTSSTFEIC